MNQRSETYMQSHDMDFIFMAHGYLIHCATNGALIPTKARAIKKLNDIRKKVLLADNILTENDLAVNEARVDRVIQAQRDLIAQLNNRHKNDNTKTRIEISDELIKNNYLASFIGMARKGLHSYDYISSTCTDNHTIIETFQLVAKPKDDFIPETNVIDRIMRNIDIPELSNIVSLTGNQLEITIE